MGPSSCWALASAIPSALVSPMPRRADPPSPDAMAALHRRCGGNPLFLGALLDTAAERGPDTDLPRNLREMVEHQLDRLQPADREVIEVAAVPESSSPRGCSGLAVRS